MTYGLTPAGFVTKPLQDIKSELEADFQTAFGADLDVSADSQAGVLIGNLSKKFANMWDLLQAVHASFNPDTAEGVNLDNSSAVTAVERLAATFSSAHVVLYGDDGTPIPQGHLVGQPGVATDFALSAAMVIEMSAAGDWSFHVANVLPLTTYTIEINFIICSFTSSSVPTAANIVAGLLASIEALIGGVSTSQVGDEGRVFSDDGATPFNINTVDANLATDLLGSPGYYVATATGPLPVPANSITTIINPITGLDSINNIVAGSTGSDIESDTAYRTRRRAELQKGLGTDSAIARAIANVSGVSSVKILDNREDTADVVNGIDPHSILAVVTGGDDQAVAQAIWDSIGGGCNTSGSVSKTIIDANGDSQTVKFSRPINMYVWLKIQATKYTEETVPTSAVQIIQAAVAAWSLANFSVGIDVILQRFIPSIYGACSGLKDITITAAAQENLSPPPVSGDYSALDIAIDPTHIAVVLQDNIQVGIL